MPRNNDLGLMGWLHGGNYGPQRYAYTIQRLTGLGIVTYLLAHVFVTGQKYWGAQRWGQTMETVHALHFGEYLVFMAMIFHALNGFRVILAEFGWTIGHPIKNVYPYQTCLDRNRVFFVIIMALVFILAVLGTADFFKVLSK